MATININGRRVKVDDSFLSLSPEQQNATVDEIAASFSTPGNVANPSRAFTDAMAGQSARGLKGKVSELPSNQPARPDFLTSAAATANGIAASVPFLQNVTDAIGGTVSQLTGGSYDEYVKHQKEVRDQLAATAPLARASGEVGGILAGGMALGSTKLGAEALGMTGTLGKQALNSMLSSTGLATADALSQGKTGTDALAAGGLGALTGLAGFGAGQAVGKLGGAIADTVTGSRQAAATARAIAGSPTAAELKAQATAMFKAVDDAGVTVDTNRFSTFVSDLVTKAKKMRINPTLDAKATGAFEELIGALDDVQRNGGALTISDMHTLRQIAQKASESVEGRDGMFAGMIVKGLDDFVTKTANLALPRNRLGEAAGGNELMAAISTWARSRRSGLVEGAIERAKNAASGFENGLRVEFRKLLNNPDNSRLWTEAEKRAIEDVVRGTTGANLAKLVGKFGFGPGANGLGGFLGGTAGLTFGGPIGAAATAIGASAARKASEKLTEKAATRAAQVVATPGVPNIPQMANPLLGAKVPIELLIRGGGLAATN